MDDPANPAYGTIQSLSRLGNSPDAQAIDDEIASVEHTMFASTDSLPILTIVIPVGQRIIRAVWEMTCVQVAWPFL